MGQFVEMLFELVLGIRNGAVCAKLLKAVKSSEQNVADNAVLLFHTLEFFVLLLLFQIPFMCFENEPYDG